MTEFTHNESAPKNQILAVDSLQPNSSGVFGTHVPPPCVPFPSGNHPSEVTDWPRPEVPVNTTEQPFSAKTTVKVNVYQIIEEKLDDAILAGLNKAYKHTDAPNRGYVAEQVLHSVMLTLSELFDFD